MITFYSTNCPKCKVLSTKLDQAGVKYNINTDINTMLSKGIKSAPAREMEDGRIMDFSQALAWVRGL